MEQLSRLALLPLLLLAACGGGGGGGADPPPRGNPEPLELLSVDPPAGSVLAWNEPLRFLFSEPLDPASVSSDALRIVSSDGAQAVGSYQLEDADRRLVFVPRCPLEPDGSDAGLLPDAEYTVEVIGGAAPGVPALTSTEGQGLEATVSLAFSTAPFVGGPVLEDPVLGPPSLVVRAAGATETTASRVVSAGVATYFEFDAGTQSVPALLNLPRQLNADPAGRFVVHVVLDQPIAPDAANLTHVTLERLDASLVWRPVPSRRELTNNGCGGGGADIELEPEVLLPALAELRVALRAGLRDLSGDATIDDDFTLAMITADAPSPGFDGLDTYGDELFEDFQTDAWLESTPSHGDPLADWGQGRLAPGGAFPGTGGPGGDFDWYIGPGEDVFLDTGNGTIAGGPNFTRTELQTTTDGRFDVRHLWIEEGGALFVFGPNPFVVYATGNVQLDGRILVDGADAPPVVALEGGSIPSPGGAGAAGGGDGGAGSPGTTSSSSAGAPGAHAWNSTVGGGRGGETGYGVGMPRDFLGAGGGGGRFARNQGDQRADPGQGGGAFSTGALTGLPPAGGAAGEPTFTDGDPTNDYWGRRRVPSLGLSFLGELDGLGAGGGGGGGGDSIATGMFPSGLVEDRRGGGGGGGAGGFLLAVQGDLAFGTSGQIHADGGDGAAGELFSGAYPVAGGGGGGSGGHIVIQVGGTFDGRFLAAEGITAIGGRASASTSTSVSSESCGGGRGGPGVIQIHVDDPLVDLLLPVPAVTLASRTEPTAEVLELDFGPRSRARSRWLAVGGTETEFSFAGIDADGRPADLDADGSIDLARPLLGPEPIDEAGLPRFEGDDVVLFDAALLEGTADEVVLGNPRLLRGAIVTVEFDGGAPERHAIATASLVGGTLRVVFETPRGPAPTLGARLALRPRHYAFVDQPHLAAQGVTLRFQGAAATPAGEPDPATFGAWTSDLDDLAGARFLRFDIAFDGEAGAVPALDELRVPFRFR